MQKYIQQFKNSIREEYDVYLLQREEYASTVCESYPVSNVRATIRVIFIF